MIDRITLASMQSQRVRMTNKDNKFNPSFSSDFVNTPAGKAHAITTIFSSVLAFIAPMVAWAAFKDAALLKSGLSEQLLNEHPVILLDALSAWPASVALGLFVMFRGITGEKEGIHYIDTGKKNY